MFFKSDYPVEALLRPPIEFQSALAAWALALLAYMAPSLIMMTESVAYATAVLLFF